MSSFTRLFLFTFFGWAFDFYDLVLLGFIRGAIAEEFHLSHSGEAWVLGVALGSSGVGGIVAGALADRIGKRTMLSATILVYSLGSLISGLAHSLPVFLVGRAVLGLGVGGEWAIGHGLLAERVRNERRGRASAALQAGEPTGALLAAFVGYVVLPHVGWHNVLLGGSVTALLAVAARRSIHIPDEPAAHGLPRFREIREAGVASRMARAFVLGTFKLGTYWTCYTWLPGFLQKEMGQGVGKSFLWMATAQVGQLLGMLSFGLVSDRFGRRPAFSIYSLVTACGIAPLVFGWSWLSQHPPLFWGSMLLLGLGSGCTAGFGALLAELFPTEIRATMMGATYNLARSVQLFAPVLVAQAVAWHGLAGGLAVPLCLALLTGTWVWVLPETRGIALPSLSRKA